jgi:hypothetical protein
MFGTIRKHQTWLWAVIITLTIVSFVIYFGPQSRVSGGRGGTFNLGAINGSPITPEEYTEAQREVDLRYFFMSGNFPGEEARRSGFDEQRETYYRLLLNQKQAELGIHPSSEAVAQVARNILHPPPKSNITSPTDFVKKLLEPRGFSMDDIERFVRHELGIQELISAVGISGKLVTPQEAKGLYEREHEEAACDAVFFSASSYLTNVPVAPEGLAMFYTNHIANYRIPDRMQVSYVEFPMSNFVAEATQQLAKLTNVNEILEAEYQKRGTNYYPDAKTPEEAKEKIREELFKELMTAAARKKAAAFADKLFVEPMRPENLAVVAKSNDLPVKITTPFEREEPPKELKANANFSKAAFALSLTNDPFGGPLVGDDAVYVIAYDKKIPSEIPALDTIRERVTADYKFDQAKVLARQAGLALYSTLTNGLAQGRSFSNICAEASSPAVELPRFSLSTRSLTNVEDRIPLNQLKQLAFSTSPGKVSNFQPTASGGLILYVKAKVPPDPAVMNSELPGFVEGVRQTRQNEAFQAWFRRQADRGLRDTPLGWPKTTPALGSRTAKS